MMITVVYKSPNWDFTSLKEELIDQNIQNMSINLNETYPMR